MQGTQPYPFDFSPIPVTLNVTKKVKDKDTGLPTDKKFALKHFLRKPTMAELLKYEQPLVTESVNADSEALVNPSAQPLLDLYAAICEGTEGYKDEASVLFDHKRTAILRLHEAEYKLVDDVADDDDLFSASLSSHVVEQTIHGMVIRHTLRTPSEAERVQFDRTSSKLELGRKESGNQTRVKLDLTVYVQFYDRLIEDVDGTVDGKTLSETLAGLSGNEREAARQKFLAQVDPFFKRSVVQKLLASFSATVGE